MAPKSPLRLWPVGAVPHSFGHRCPHLCAPLLRALRETSADTGIPIPEKPFLAHCDTETEVLGSAFLLMQGLLPLAGHLTYAESDHRQTPQLSIQVQVPMNPTRPESCPNGITRQGPMELLMVVSPSIRPTCQQTSCTPSIAPFMADRGISRSPNQ